MVSRVSQVIAGFAILAAAMTASAQQLYRYEDDNGNMVWGTSVPAHLAIRGYRVFDSKGRFIREVESRFTADDRQERQRMLRVEAREAELKEQQRQMDNMLLRRYSSVEDFESRRKLNMDALNDRREAARLRVDEVSAQIEVINMVLLKARRREEQPPALQVSEKANLDAVRLRLMQDLAKIDEEIRVYREQSDLEHARLQELIAGFSR